MARGNETGKGGFADHPEHRNNNGQRSSKVVAFSRTLRELIVKEGQSEYTAIDSQTGKRVTRTKIEWAIQTLYAAALDGQSWALLFIAERVEGKIKEQVEQSGGLTVRVEYVKRFDRSTVTTSSETK